MAEWTTYTLEQLAAPHKSAMSTGPFGSAISSRHFTDRGVPVIRGSNLSADVGVRLIDNDLAFLSEEKAAEFARSQVGRGDLVFTCWGTIGQIGLIDEQSRYDRYIISNKQMKLTPNLNIVDPLFLYYALSTPDAILAVQNSSIGSSVPGFNLGQLKQLRVSVPPKAQQECIVNVLAALDEKIAVNDRIATTCDELSSAIFQRNFNHPENDGSNGHWPNGVIADICTTQYGHTASAEKSAVGPRFLRVMDINKRNWINWDKVPYCPADTSIREKYSLRKGDILVARMADPGKSAIVETEVHAVFASYLVRLKTSTLAEAYYLYGFLKSKRYSEYCVESSRGSVQSNMNAKVIVAAALSMPPRKLIEQHLEQILPLRERISQAINENLVLSQVRDTLLPKLMSNELRVRDAERLVEDAV